MSHEMIRREADEAGFDTADAVVSIRGDTVDDDIVDVWGQLPAADDFNPPDAA